MKYVYFQVIATFPQTGSDNLNVFLANHSVVSIVENFVADGQDSFWSIPRWLPTQRMRIILH